MQGKHASKPGDKADRRIARTKQALHEALMHCLMEQEYHAISVSDITERANVGRSTFYAHFADKEDLLLESLEGLRSFLQNDHFPAGPDVHPALAWSHAMFEHILEVGPTFRVLVGRPGGSPVRAHLESMLGQMVLERLSACPPRSGLPLPALAAFIVSGFLTVAIWWSSQERRLPTAEIDALFRRQVEQGLGTELGATHDDVDSRRVEI